MPDAPRGITLLWPSGDLAPEDIVEIECTLRAYRWRVVARYVWEGVAYLDVDPPRGPRNRAPAPNVGHAGVVTMRPRAVA